MPATIDLKPVPKVLVVDDDEIVREASKVFLTGAGFSVQQAENGLLAMEALKTLRPDIILLDVIMPEMDGFDTSQAIRQLAGYENLPILIMTALEDMESINQAFEAGATDFITKPINWVILVERIRFMVRAVRVMDEQQRLQKELIRAQKMEAIGTLAGGVAHDLNNVLSGIVGYPEMLLWKLDQNSPLRKPITAIHEAGLKAADIVQDLLTLTRRGVNVEEVLDINEIVREYTDSPEYKKLMSFHQRVSVETNLDPDLLHIVGSPIHIRKSIMNLVSNAAEAQPDGGNIHIVTYNQTLNSAKKGYELIPAGEFTVLKVADRGCGISKQELNRIFEPFYSKKFMGRSGTGLGMAVVWGTVQDHHGHIDIKSTPNQGTTFYLYFPATRKAVKRKDTVVPVNHYMGDGETILIVDDAQEQQQFAASILKMLNYKPVAVSSGEEAIETLKNQTVDLILLDMIMPSGMDGLETYKKVLEVRPDQKAIITSGYTETDRVKQTQQLGAGSYIKKPYKMETIGLAIRDELQKTA